MPNWCSTKMTVSGPEGQVKDFYNGVLRAPYEGEPSVKSMRIVQAYFPIPEELNITATTAWETIPDRWQEWVSDGTWTQEKYDKEVAENNELLAQQKANIAKYGHKDWYEWCIANWGTKWGDCDTMLENPHGDADNPNKWYVNGYFQTAWGPATEAFIKISAMFPDCFFEFTHDEEAGFFAGIEIIKNGQVVFSADYAPCEYPDEVDWDDDDSTEKYYEWKDDHMTLIEQKRNEFMAGVVQL